MRRYNWQGYGFAVAFVAIASFVRFMLDPVLGELQPYATYYVAVAAAAWFGGLGPAVFSVIISSAIADYMFIAPRLAFGTYDAPHLLALGLFVLTGFGMAAFSERLRRERVRADEQVEAANRERLAAIFENEQRKQVEEQLRVSEERLRLSQQIAKMGGWDWNLQRNAISWSENYWAIYGLQPNSMQPTYESWLRCVHPDDREKVHQKTQEALRNRFVKMAVEFRTVWPDRSVHWLVSVGEVERDTQGNPVRAIGATLDITERKRAEDALLTSEKLAATGRLAASIAHEINNPLAAITNLVYLAKQDPVQSERYLEAAEQELQRVAHIARQTLRFYRDTSAALPVNLAESVNDVIAVYRAHLKDKNIALETQFKVTREVTAFQGEVRQILSNLVANAIDAVPNGGQLKIRVSDSRDWKDSERGGARVTIADTGSGMEPDQLSQIFEPFFTTKPTGAGLGLWLTHELIEKHGGSVHVRSSQDREHSGTVFSIFFPEHQSAQASSWKISA